MLTQLIPKDFLKNGKEWCCVFWRLELYRDKAFIIQQWHWSIRRLLYFDLIRQTIDRPLYFIICGKISKYLSGSILSWTPSAVTINDWVTSDWTISIVFKVFSPIKVHWLSTRCSGMPWPCHNTLNLSAMVFSGLSFCSWCSWRIIFCSYSIRPLIKGSTSSSSRDSSLMLSRDLTRLPFLRNKIAMRHTIKEMFESL